MYTLTEAANVTGKQKSTILKAIRSARISATKNEQGEWQIDPDELSKAYQPLSEVEKLKQLEAELSALKEELQKEKELREEMRIDRDYWREQAQALIVIAGKLRDQEEELGQPQGKPQEQPREAEPEPEPTKKGFGSWFIKAEKRD